jgi:hypothetical protein
MNTRLINGPINVLRLEGNINNISKIIYIYMDYHLPINKQLQCNDFSIDIQHHFTENLKHINNNIDFFLEIWPSKLSIKDNIYKGRYIDEVARFFKKNINHSKLKKQDIHNKNIIRYHYIDIRDVLETTIYQLLLEFLNIVKKNSCNETFPDIELLNEIKNKLSESYNLIYDITFNEKSYDETTILPEYKDTYNIIKQYINKILFKYKNLNIKSIINNKLYDLVKPYFKKIFNLLDKITEIIDKIKYMNTSHLKLKHVVINGNNNYGYGYSLPALRKLLFQLTEYIDAIDTYSLYLFSKYIDIFFLRRFLDKEYITTAITYTGSDHSIIYITILLQEFNFNITHCSYNKLNNIMELNNKIKNIKKNYEIKNLLYPPILSQCSNLNNFPQYFN